MCGAYKIGPDRTTPPTWAAAAALSPVVIRNESYTGLQTVRSPVSHYYCPDTLANNWEVRHTANWAAVYERSLPSSDPSADIVVASISLSLSISIRRASFVCVTFLKELAICPRTSVHSTTTNITGLRFKNTPRLHGVRSPMKYLLLTICANSCELCGCDSFHYNRP